MHWIAIKPEYKNKGLGLSIVNKILELSILLDGDKNNYVHTQTWSYEAIGIYIKARFKIIRSGTFANFNNNFYKALPYLKVK